MECRMLCKAAPVARMVGRGKRLGASFGLVLPCDACKCHDMTNPQFRESRQTQRQRKPSTPAWQFTIAEQACRAAPPPHPSFPPCRDCAFVGRNWLAQAAQEALTGET